MGNSCNHEHKEEIEKDTIFCTLRAESPLIFLDQWTQGGDWERYYFLYPASRVSFDLPRSVTDLGRSKETLLAGYICWSCTKRKGRHLPKYICAYLSLQWFLHILNSKVIQCIDLSDTNQQRGRQIRFDQNTTRIKTTFIWIAYYYWAILRSVEPMWRLDWLAGIQK